MNNSIHIDHGDDHKWELFEKFKSHLIFRREQPNDMLTNKWPYSFTGMLPGSYQDDLFAGVVTSTHVKAGNGVPYLGLSG